VTSPVKHHADAPGLDSRPDEVNRALLSLARVVQSAPETHAPGAQEELCQMALADRMSASDLRHVRQLGEGAFALVDLCEYVGDAARLLPGRTSGRYARISLEPSEPECSADGHALVALKKMRTHLPALASPDGGPEHKPTPVPPNWITFALCEGVLLRTLRHPNLVACYGCVVPATSEGREADPSSLHFVLEFMPGGTLRERISRGDYGAMQGLRWLLDVAHGLAYLHDAVGASLAHRDLKPENVLLSAAGVAKIADLGLCKIGLGHERGSSAAGGSDRRPCGVPAPPRRYNTAKDLLARADRQRGESAAGGDGRRSDGLARARDGTSYPQVLRRSVQDMTKRLTQSIRRASTSAPRVAKMTGRTGSYLFMAPENYLNKPYTSKVDLFALGVIAIEVLARRPAYQGRHLLPEQVAEGVALCGLRPAIPGSWPASVQSLIRACLHDDPDERPDALEVVRLLREVVAHAIASPESIDALERGGALAGCFGACGGRRRAPPAARKSSAKGGAGLHVVVPLAVG
jgi:serine/threonine protein kinase